MTFSPCPKPERREKKPRKEIRRVSEKRAARLAAERALPVQRKEILRSPLKKTRVNAAKRERQFGIKSGKAAFTRSRPCAACKVEGYSQNAHVGRRAGMGLRGTATTTLPLCGPRPLNRGGMYEGCHHVLDNGQGRDYLESKYRIDLLREAEKHEADFQHAKASGELS